MWHHYAGPALEVVELDSSVSGHVRKTILGKNLGSPPFNQLQHVVRAGTWFGARVLADAASTCPAVVGCTVSPSFDFADFTLGDRGQLLRMYAYRFPHRHFLRGTLDMCICGTVLVLTLLRFPQASACIRSLT
jgi:predicted cupin superfamily sugar epimerase